MNPVAEKIAMFDQLNSIFEKIFPFPKDSVEFKVLRDIFTDGTMVNIVMEKTKKQLEELTEIEKQLIISETLADPRLMTSILKKFVKHNGNNFSHLDLIRLQLLKDDGILPADCIIPNHMTEEFKKIISNPETVEKYQNYISEAVTKGQLDTKEQEEMLLWGKGMITWSSLN